MQPFAMHHFQGCKATLKTLCINFGGELSTIATLMFTVLLNSSALLNLIQSYHPHSHQYTDMQPFAMHCFQGCRGSLKSVSKILGVSYPSLLHLIDAVLHVMLNISALLNPDHMYPSPLTWIQRCATLWNAPFSKRQSIPELVMHQF